jgi:phospholipid transport system transporter-binding protein
MMIDTSATPYRVTAAMTYANAAALLAQGKAVITVGETVFDLGGVTSADSAALAVIIGWQRAAAGQGSIRLTNLPESIRSLAKLYSITDIIPALPA